MDASRTALGVMWLRAAHLVLDGQPKLLDDHVALALLGPDAPRQIAERGDVWSAAGMRALRSHVLLRSRFAEDRLASAVARGVRQLVVLGAGYDTFAYRQPAWASPLRLFEVDHPASQAAKRDALRSAGVGQPANLTYVSVDFERQQLAAELASAGFDAFAPAFVSWLGVMMYLTEEASDAVFRFVASLPRASEIVFTFSSQSGRSGDAASAFFARMSAAVAEAGEPFRQQVEPDALVAKLGGFGFSDVFLLDPADAAARYFSDRTDGLPPPRRSSIAAAVV